MTVGKQQHNRFDCEYKQTDSQTERETERKKDR